MEEGTLPLESFSFVLESENRGCQQRNAVKGMGRKGEKDQTSKAGQFLRQHRSTLKKFCNQFHWAIGSQCSLAIGGETYVRVEVLKIS